MKKLALVAAISTLAIGSQLAFAAPDWGKVPKRDVNVFHAGISTLEWVVKKSEHSGSTGLRKGETCIGCHEEKGTLNVDLKRLASKQGYAFFLRVAHVMFLLEPVYSATVAHAGNVSF